MKPLARTRPGVWLAAALLLAAGACSGGGERPVYPVRGKVFAKGGKPAHRAIVWLHPEAKSTSESKSQLPHGVVEQDGSFQLSTYGKDDGAPPGRYRVTVIWTAPGKFSGDDTGKSLLPARYSNPQLSGLPVVEIKEGPNELPPFELTP
jgi:hypothetical protein